MPSFKSFAQRLFQVNDVTFNDFALELFRYQAANNPVYKKYVSYLGVDINSVHHIHQIPFLPISFFKEHKVRTDTWPEEIIYESSGTTGSKASKHYIRSNQFYLQNTELIFNRFYGGIDDYHTLFLLPGYIERGSSSLVAMADSFIKKSNSKYSGFYLNDHKALIQNIDAIRKSKKSNKIILCGVSFALIQLAETLAPDLSDVIVMETGGMKGRRKEMIREELHNYLKDRFKVQTIHSEYGMTELSSQAYSLGQGKFLTPPWMKILLRDTNDPLDVGTKSSGGINVIDLANISSCAFVETQDLGLIDDLGKLEILGRFDNSDIRGCNLMV